MKLTGMPLNIIQRVDNNFKCFYKTKDCQFYLDRLFEASQEHKVAIHAYVLMPDHVHLLVTQKCDGSASKMMRLLGKCYTYYFNREYYRSGELWEERFRSCIIDADKYLLACQRYIELNPVRSGMVDHPAEYIWSSYSTNALGESSKLLRPHVVYEALGINKPECIEAYRDLFRNPLEPCLIDEISEHTNGGYCLGSDEFKQEIEIMLGRRIIRGRPVARVQLRS